MLLKSIKVLDLSTLLPGPLCSLFLADLGAEVIKVESLNGDFMRHFEMLGKKSPYFSALNRNKKSIAINLKAAEGRKIFIDIAKDTDVIIEGFRPGKSDALGIGYKSIKKVNPKIVYCSISGYGQKGPYKNKAGHDLNYSGLSGMLDVLSSNPFVPGVQMADAASAFIAAFSIVSALYNREKTGKGSYIDVSIFGSALSVIGMHFARHSVSKNRKTVLSGSKACYNVYETKDGKYASFGAIETKFWNSFCDAVKRSDLVSKQFDEGTIKEVKKIFKSKEMGDWLRLRKKYDFCCEPVKKIEDVIRDKELNKRGNFVDIDGFRQAAMPVIFSSVKKISYKKAPKLGENTMEIMHQMGYGKGYISRLKKSGVVL
ncbi:CoA transferase [Candidatus Woesearchaeota archaeon]|nr:CoA transferase [Candidatus Woesearchaeota archaeon]